MRRRLASRPPHQSAPRGADIWASPRIPTQHCEAANGVEHDDSKPLHTETNQDLRAPHKANVRPRPALAHAHRRAHTLRILGSIGHTHWGIDAVDFTLEHAVAGVADEDRFRLPVLVVHRRCFEEGHQRALEGNALAPQHRDAGRRATGEVGLCDRS